MRCCLPWAAQVAGKIDCSNSASPEESVRENGFRQGVPVEIKGVPVRSLRTEAAGFASNALGLIVCSFRKSPL